MIIKNSFIFLDICVSGDGCNLGVLFEVELRMEWEDVLSFRDLVLFCRGLYWKESCLNYRRGVWGSKGVFVFEGFLKFRVLGYCRRGREG